MSDETTEERIERRLEEAFGFGHFGMWGPIAVVMAEELKRLDERYARREHEHSPHAPRYR